MLILFPKNKKMLYFFSSLVYGQGLTGSAHSLFTGFFPCGFIGQADNLRQMNLPTKR